VWLSFIRCNTDKWNRLVDSFAYVDSCSDIGSPARTLAFGSSVVLNFQCRSCNKAFSNSKTLQQHCRTLHGERNGTRSFVEADGICPVCNGSFVTRYRCIRHIDDRRNDWCKAALLSGAFTPLLAERVKELDQLLQKECREARRCGHSHPIASGPAHGPDGKMVGHVSR